MKTISVANEIKRIRLGYGPTSNVWYYQVLYYICAQISIIKMRLSNMLNMRSGYKCSRCGKKSNDASVIFDCVYNHEYVEGRK